MASAAALLSAASLLARIVQLITTSILARILLPRDYGVVALAMTAVGLLDVISNLQVGGSIIRSSRIDRSHLDTAFTINFIRGLVSATMLLAISIPASMLLHEPRLAPVICALSAIPIINGLQNQYFIMYEKDINFRPEFIRLASTSFITAATGIASALYFRSYWALVLSSTVSATTYTFFTYWKTPGRPAFSLSRAREMLGFGSWLTLVGIIEYANSRVDVLLIGRGLGSAKLGAYQVGQQIITTATGDIVAPLSRAIFPALSLFADDPVALRQNYERMQSVIIGLALPAGMGMSALAREAILLLLGSRWMQALPVVQFLSPLIALQTMLAVVDAVAMTKGRTRSLFNRTLTVFAVRVTLLVIGFTLGGFMGVIYARVLSGTFYLLYGLGLAGRLTGTPYLSPVLRSWRSVVSGAAMAALLYALPQYHGPEGKALALIAVVAGKAALGALVYLGVHTLLWWLARRPEGFESLVVKQAQKIGGKFGLAAA
ncbi:MAG: lipopolysaccharide biosynthesis protein [Caulobacteraceae bacterium]